MQDLGEQIVTATMMGRLEADVGDKLLEIHTMVVRTIKCPITGRVLDSRTAHLIVGGSAFRSDLGSAVVHPTATNEQVEERLAVNDLLMTSRFDPADAWAAIREGASS